jgi:hypothetical protein
MAARLPGSFRDPAGHIYISSDIIYRRIEPAGRAAYERLMQSGLYAALVADGLLISHDDLGAQADQVGAWTVIRPERVPLVSYPYEWCFSQLRDAALLTLRVERRAREFGLSLKDASAFNVQFLRGRPVLIDTLSFEPCPKGPWAAYRQFCQHFLAPLLLISRSDSRLSRLSQVFMDGVPLSLASRLLPPLSWLRPGVLMHIHLHAKAEEKLSGRTPVAFVASRKDPGTPLPLIESLERTIEKLEWKPRSRWSSYYADQPSYEQDAFTHKRETVKAWLARVRPATVWDLGSNTGEFSRLAVDCGANAVAFDADEACVEVMYREVRARQIDRLLPLVSDLASPSPAIGWGNTERMTLEQRGPADLVLALALVHHLAIANNVPFAEIADYFARLGRRVIVELIPRADGMVRQMMAGREEAFPGYDVEPFERAFAARFSVDERAVLTPSDRVLYLMTARP